MFGYSAVNAELSWPMIKTEPKWSGCGDEWLRLVRWKKSNKAVLNEVGKQKWLTEIVHREKIKHCWHIFYDIKKSVNHVSRQN